MIAETNRRWEIVEAFVTLLPLVPDLVEVVLVGVDVEQSLVLQSLLAKLTLDSSMESKVGKVTLRSQPLPL